MKQLIISGKINDLADEQVCKAALWLVDELKEQAKNEMDFIAQLEMNKDTYREIFSKIIGQSDSQKIAVNWENENDLIQFARQFMCIMAAEPMYERVVEEILQTIGKTRLSNEVTTLFNNLKDTIPLWLLIYLTWKFEIRFKIVKEEANKEFKGKRKVEFEVSFGKQGSLNEFLNKFKK